MFNIDTLSLSPCSPRAVEKLIFWAKDPEYKEFFRHFPPRFEWEANEGFLQNLLLNSLEVRKSDEIIGLVYLSQLCPSSRSISVSVIVAHPEHSLVADHVYEQVQDYVFNEKDFNRIQCTILEHRVGLKARLEAIGFQTEGLLRQSSRLGSEWVLGLLRSDRRS